MCASAARARCIASDAAKRRVAGNWEFHLAFRAVRRGSGARAQLAPAASQATQRVDGAFRLLVDLLCRPSAGRATRDRCLAGMRGISFSARRRSRRRDPPTETANAPAGSAALALPSTRAALTHHLSEALTQKQVELPITGEANQTPHGARHRKDDVRTQARPDGTMRVQAAPPAPLRCQAL